MQKRNHVENIRGSINLSLGELFYDLFWFHKKLIKSVICGLDTTLSMLQLITNFVDLNCLSLD